MNELRNLLIEVTQKKERFVDLLKKIIEVECKNSHLIIKLELREFLEPFHSYTENSIIYIKPSLLEKVDFSNRFNQEFNFLLLIKNIYHEIAHIYQQNDYKKQILSDRSMLYMVTHLIDDWLDPDDYIRNYYCQELEIDANLYAYSKMKLLVKDTVYEKSIVPFILEKEKELLFIRLLLAHITGDTEVTSILEYYNNSVKKIIISHPNLVQQHVLLKIFYTTKGEKSLKEILQEGIISSHYENIRITVFRFLFLRIIREQIRTIEGYSPVIQKRYVELFLKIGFDWIKSARQILSGHPFAMNSINYSITIYQQNLFQILDKIEELLMLSVSVEYAEELKKIKEEIESLLSVYELKG